MVYVATEGYGKTTVAALAPDPVIVMAPDELGYLTLLSRELVPAVPVIQPRTWPDLLGAIDAFGRDPQGRKTLALDAMAGLETLLATHICVSQFGGDWGEKGFAAWGRGRGIVGREWPMLLSRLTSIARLGINVLILGHAKVKRFDAPDGPAYDRYECNVGTDEVWARTKAWAEAVLFGSFRAIVEQSRPESNTAKAHGKAVAHQRILRCQYSAVADAKNQWGLAPEYVLSDDPAACASEFWSLVKPNTGGKR